MVRQLARLGVVGVLAVAGSALWSRGDSAVAVQPWQSNEWLEITPLWRPAADVLVRPVGEAPWNSRPASQLGIDDATHGLLRWNSVFNYAKRYRITMELARQIHDIALEEKIEPELAFRLVRLESRFDPAAVSPVGAIGLTQLMLGTARYFQPGVTEEALMDPGTNLHIGFRYLRGLVREYRGDLRIALLVYNRGPVAVMNAIAMGEDPANGYERIVLRGYKGSGVID